MKDDVINIKKPLRGNKPTIEDSLTDLVKRFNNLSIVYKLD